MHLNLLNAQLKPESEIDYEILRIKPNENNILLLREIKLLTRSERKIYEYPLL